MKDYTHTLPNKMFIFLVVFLLFPFSFLSAQTLVINGSPLEIHVQGDGTIGVIYHNDTNALPQYYSTFAKGSSLFLNGTNANMRWGNGKSTFALWDNDSIDTFTAVSHTQPDPWTIQTVLAAGNSGVNVSQSIHYDNGSTFYTLDWAITPDGQFDGNLSDLRFIHGGDISPGGEDMAVGYWDAASNMVYVIASNGNSQIFMGLQGDDVNPPVSYYEAHFQLVRDATKAGALLGTVNAAEHDAAYALQWNIAQLTPENSWSISAREHWSRNDTPAEEFGDITSLLAQPLFSWVFSRQTGTYFGTLTLRLADGQASIPLHSPVRIALSADTTRRYVSPDGLLPNGAEYIDISSQVATALSDGTLDSSDTVVIQNIEVYMRDRTQPPDSAFSLWATSTAITP